FRVWRLKRAVRLLEDVRQIASDNGLKLKPVARRVLFPILEAASLEEDKELHKRWVALLTNAARADSDVLPSFPDILRQLTGEDAQFLDEAYDQVVRDDRQKRARSVRKRYPETLSKQKSKTLQKYMQELNRDGLLYLVDGGCPILIPPRSFVSMD